MKRIDDFWPAVAELVGSARHLPPNEAAIEVAALFDAYRSLVSTVYADCAADPTRQRLFDAAIAIRDNKSAAS